MCFYRLWFLEKGFSFKKSVNMLVKDIKMFLKKKKRKVSILSLTILKSL